MLSTVQSAVDKAMNKAAIGGFLKKLHQKGVQAKTKKNKGNVAAARRSRKANISQPRLNPPIKFSGGDSAARTTALTQRSHTTIGPGAAGAGFPVSYNNMSLAILDANPDNERGIFVTSVIQGAGQVGAAGTYALAASYTPSLNVALLAEACTLRTVAAYAKIQYTGPPLYAQSTFIIAHAAPENNTQTMANIAANADGASQSMIRVTATQLTEGFIVPFRAASIGDRTFTHSADYFFPTVMEDQTMPFQNILIFGRDLAASGTVDVTITRHVEVRWPLGSVGHSMSSPPNTKDHPIVEAVKSMAISGVAHAAAAAQPILEAAVSGMAHAAYKRGVSAVMASRPLMIAG